MTDPCAAQNPSTAPNDLEALAPHCGRISSCCDRRLCCAQLTPEHPHANVRTHHKTVSAVDFSREHSPSTGLNVCPATTTQPCTEARTHPAEQRRQGKGLSENTELEHGRMWEKEGNKHIIPLELGVVPNCLLDGLWRKQNIRQPTVIRYTSVPKPFSKILAAMTAENTSTAQLPYMFFKAQTNPRSHPAALTHSPTSTCPHPMAHRASHLLLLLTTVSHTALTASLLHCLQIH